MNLFFFPLSFYGTIWGFLGFYAFKTLLIMIFFAAIFAGVLKLLKDDHLI